MIFFLHIPTYFYNWNFTAKLWFPQIIFNNGAISLCGKLRVRYRFMGQSNCVDSKNSVPVLLLLASSIYSALKYSVNLVLTMFLHCLIVMFEVFMLSSRCDRLTCLISFPILQHHVYKYFLSINFNEIWSKQIFEILLFWMKIIFIQKLIAALWI